MRSLHTLAAAAALAVLPAAAQAETLAYLNFEDGVAGQPVFENPGNQTVDVTGNGNDFRAFNLADSADFSANVPYAVTPGTGAANTLSVAHPADLYDPDGPLRSYNFSNGFTLEAAVLTNNLDQFGGVFGKDGKPTDSALAPLQLKLRNDTDRYQIEVVSTAGTGYEVQTNFVPTVGEWYSLAATYDGTTMSLWAKPSSDAGDYELQGSVEVPDIASDFTSTLTIGRGFYNGNIGDFFNGNIDDVRVSDVALAPSQFLGSAAAIPEPSSLALLGIGGLGLLARRRA